MRALIPILIAAMAVPLAIIPATAQDDDEPSYLLPAPAGQALLVSAGNAHPTGRHGNERFAFDLVATDDPETVEGQPASPVGNDEAFTVVAARGGTVIGQRSSVVEGRCPQRATGPRPDCWRQVNYLLIDHGDGTSGLYLHLRRGSTFVGRGDIVAVGTPIGISGQSGWTNDIGLQFQVQETPDRLEVGAPGWFMTRALPISFADPSVTELRSTGVPRTGDVVVSANVLADRAPFASKRRPVDLAAAVPLSAGDERDIVSAYDPDSPDGWGLSFGSVPPSAGDDGFADPGTEVRPVFGGELVFAGCATGRSASLGLTVIVRQSLDEDDFLAVLGHLSDVEPELLESDPDDPLVVEPDQLLGHHGATDEDGFPVEPCPGAASTDLFMSILEDAVVSPEGEITAETPISPEPLRGRGAYEGFAWWDGPVEGVRIDDEPGRPRSSWTSRATRSGTHVDFGDPVILSARVRDSADIAEVRFRAYYFEWPRPGAATLERFDPRTTWRQIAICRPPGSSGVPSRTRGCDWDGGAEDAVVTYRWLPTEAGVQPAAPWLPRARIAITDEDEACVPVSLAVEVIDVSGHARALDGSLPLPARCDDDAAEDVEDAHLVYLDPLAPPATPGTRGATGIRTVPPNAPDPLDGDVVWRDLSTNEDGFRIYARREWFDEACDVATGPYVLIDTLPADARRYEPRHNRILRLTPIPPRASEGPGTLNQYRLYVAAFNEAGETPRVFVGGFFIGLDAFCDEGLGGPDVP